MDKNLEIIQSICLQLYKGIGQDKVFQKQKENKAFQQFLDRLYKQYGKAVVDSNFLWSFLTYNMSSLYGRKTQFGSMVMLNWLLSMKSIERWNSRNQEFSDYHISEFLIKYGVKREVSFEKVDLEDIEEIERMRFLNTEVGFFNCQSLTSYNSESECCKQCNFKIECIK